MRVVRPRPEAPPRPRGAGDLGPAKAESPALSRVAEAHLDSRSFGAPHHALLTERFLAHAQVTREQVRDRSCARVQKPLRRDAHPTEERYKLRPRVEVKVVRL